MMNAKMTAMGWALIGVLAGCGVVDGSDDDDCSDCQKWQLDDSDPDPHFQGLMPCGPDASADPSVSWAEVVDEQWDGDRLLQRVEVLETYPDPRRLESNWRYDDSGRLMEATTEIDDRLAGRSVWTYDGDKPKSVERFVGGVAVERQSWDYAQNRLVTRHVELAGGGLDEEVEFEQIWYALESVDAHDTYSARRDHRTSGELDDDGQWRYPNPWKRSNAHLHIADDDHCYSLPASSGHGYPADESAYHLGLKANSPGDQNIYDYGYSGYAPRAWYGHIGVATSWPVLLAYRTDYDVEATIHYDEHGQMVSESLAFLSAMEARNIVVKRQRDFSDAGLTKDQITVEEEGRPKAGAVLYFERDTEGRLLHRQRYRNKQRVSHQTWSYDEGGQAQSLEVYIERPDSQASGGYYYGAPNPSPAKLLDDVETTVEHSVTYER